MLKRQTADLFRLALPLLLFLVLFSSSIFPWKLHARPFCQELQRLPALDATLLLDKDKGISLLAAGMAKVKELILVDCTAVVITAEGAFRKMGAFAF
jgi:hypothetical protein